MATLKMLEKIHGFSTKWIRSSIKALFEIKQEDLEAGTMFK